MPKTINGKSNKERTEAFKALNTRFGFSEYDLHIYATKIRKSFIGNHLDSTTAQKIATRAFKAVQRLAFGQAKRVRFTPLETEDKEQGKCYCLKSLTGFKGKNQFKSVEGKTNKTGIRYNENTGHVEWKGLKLKSIIDVNDKVVVHGLSHRVKYCRIIKRIFNGKTRFFVQLVLEGKPKIKEKNSSPDNIVGLDIGPSTIAYVSDKQAKLSRFCDELKDKQKEIRRLQRSLERKRRANNPQNYSSDGTIKKGKKKGHESLAWHDSKRYLKTKTKLAELQRKLAAHRKSLHGNLANRILKQGKHIKTEKLSYRAFQRKYGKSVKDRAPGMFVETLRRKAENAGGSVNEFSTKDTKLSQYCHNCGKYTKKPLSQRWHTCCDLNIQRDLYSAFLAGSVHFVHQRLRLMVRCAQPRTGAFAGSRLVENKSPQPPFEKGGYKLDTADVAKRWRSTEAVLQQAVSEIVQVANGRQLPSSFGCSCRGLAPAPSAGDRATRLRSSDAPDAVRREIPDAKDQDVVAVQLCSDSRNWVVL